MRGVVQNTNIIHIEKDLILFLHQNRFIKEKNKINNSIIT